MTENDSAQADQLIREAGREEKRFLAREAKAEAALERALTRLSKAESRLAGAQAQFEQRIAAVAKAGSELKTCQEARAQGPSQEPDIGEPDASNQSGHESHS
jgi:hypothetical protein